MNGSRPRRHGMTMCRPAARWQEALPSGNGPLGAMVYGGIAQETVLLNHQGLWHGGCNMPIPDVSDRLPELRRLLAEGNFDDADNFLTDILQEKGYRYVVDSYHPACDLRIDAPLRHPFRNYRRSLDFETGEVTVAWRDGQTDYRRRLFVSRTDDLVALVFEADGPDGVDAAFRLAPHPHELIVNGDEGSVPLPIGWYASAGRDFLVFFGRNGRDIEFGAVAQVRCSGGTMSAASGGIEVRGAKRVQVLVRLFAGEPASEAVPSLQKRMTLEWEDYETLFERHRAVHRELFLRMRLDLHAPENERARENEYLLLDAYNGDLSEALVERMFDYGRYLLMSSSRGDDYPCNLQGVWNGDYSPPWNAAYTNNENVQMCYWQALPGNIPEVVHSCFRLLEFFAETYRDNARKIYGCRGFLLPLANSPLAAQVMEFSPHALYWTGAGAWMAQLFYDYYLFTGDETFLRERAVPFMREVCRFYEDFLFIDEDGYYTFAPSNSPENSPTVKGRSSVALEMPQSVAVNATMDVALAKEVLSNLVEACETLGIEADGVERWKEMLRRMRPYEVNEDGALREWLHPELKDNYHHRHQSHIYPLFPGFEITRESDPRLFEACRVAIDKRLVIGLASQSGWSLAHMANVNARLGRGDEAWNCLATLAQSCVGENLFTYHNDWRGQGLCVAYIHGRSAPFQIDANMGWTAAVLEMLLFSKPGDIRLLPALPSRWRRGRAEGLLCRGGVEAAVEWDRHEGTVRAALRSRRAQWIELRFPAPVLSIATQSEGVPVSSSERGRAWRRVRLEPDTPLVLRATLDAAFGAEAAAGLDDEPLPADAQ